MRVVRVKHHHKGYREIRTSPGAQRMTMEQAQRIAGAAGDGYVAESTTSPRNRARAAAITGTYRAMKDNSSNNTLLRVM